MNLSKQESMNINLHNENYKQNHFSPQNLLLTPEFINLSSCSSSITLKINKNMHKIIIRK